ncbi:MAG: SDR family oxidoreductase [Planctomycetales bacterium]|nr:SDR family oxidoreductase [Planctomycetales bacterium]MBN8627327.1 SDR family oxidoreductase [Planctomycetota bacterium]
MPTTTEPNAAAPRRTAVVTGSSGGIGAAVARKLAAQGYAVVVHGRNNAARAEEVAAEVRKTGGEAIVLLADVADAADCARLVEQAWQWCGGVDVWVNNAGVDVLTGPTAKWSFDEKLAALWKVDVAGTMRLSREVGRRMVERGGGAIINIGWDQAATGMAGDSGEMFAAVKGAVMAFTKSLAHSLAPSVRVNCVAPGWIKTEWGDAASEYWQARAVGESLRARWGTPDDIADAIAFLASPAADFITGHVLPVNGGFRHGAAYPKRDANT